MAGAAFSALLLLVPGWTEASELRVGIAEEPVTLDPGNHRQRKTQAVLRNIFDALLTRDDDMNVVPELAESWSQLDPVTYEFVIRQGVSFHSGDELTAEDVKFSFDRLITPGAIGGKDSPRRSLAGPLRQVIVVDRYRVRFVLDKPWPILTAMLPFHLIVKKPSAGAGDFPDLGADANGTGPYRLVEWRKGEAVVLERYDGYFGGAPAIRPVRPPRIDRVVFRVLPDNDARTAALLDGSVHIIEELPLWAIEKLGSEPELLVASTNGTRTHYVAFNLRRPALADLRVRQALNHAVDKTALVDEVLGGLATPIKGPLSPAAFGFNPDLPSYPYDPQKSKALLTAAGYPDGLNLTLETWPAKEDLAIALADRFSSSGIRVEVRIRKAEELRDAWVQAKGDEGDLLLTNWGNASLDPAGILMPTLHSQGRGHRGGYANPEVDRLLVAADSEIDRGSRADLYRRVQELVVADAPWIFLWIDRQFYGVNRRVRGWLPRPDGLINLHDSYLEE